MTNGSTLILVLFGIGSLASSCNRLQQRSVRHACSDVAERLDRLPIRGQIYGPVGEKLFIPQCGNRKIPYAFIGDPPIEYERLARLAEQRALANRPDAIIGFVGTGSGYIVEESANEPLLLIASLAGVREDPSVTARYRRLEEEARAKDKHG